VSARLIRKAEECKEDKGTQDVRPAFHLETDSHVGIIFPDETSDLDDPMIVAVGVFPTDPWCHTHLRIVHNEKRPQRNSEKHFDAGNDHQADVATAVQTTIGRHELPGLTFALEERMDGQSTIDKRHTTNCHGPRVEEEKGRWHKYDTKAGAEILENVVTMSRNYVLEYHLENRYAQPDEQIDQDRAALSRFPDGVTVFALPIL